MLQLLVLQSTPFCNIDCSYCYLPDRGKAARMSVDTAGAVAKWVVETGLLGPELTILWHAGEPLCVPIAHYRELAAILDDGFGALCRLRYRFQTNATLIDPRWCEFFLERDTTIGVSLDGPDFVHDAYRKSRSGQGTHSRVMQGIEILQQAGVPFHVLVTVNSLVLRHRKEVLSFFEEAGIRDLAFNIETILGVNEASSISDSHWDELRELLRDLLALATADRLHVREFSHAARRLSGPPCQTASTMSTPGTVLTIDVEGNVSPFSPELSGHASPRYGSFSLGNIREKSYADMISSDRFRLIAGDIRAGVDACRAECGYFPFCGGASPANKYFEHGTFRSTETTFCRFHVQLPIDLILSRPGSGGVREVTASP